MKRILVLIAFLLWVPAAFAQPMSVLNSGGSSTLCSINEASCPIAVDEKGGLQMSITGGSGVHAEDSASTSGDPGVVMLGVRMDSAGAGTTDTDSDYNALTTNNRGILYVDIRKAAQYSGTDGLLKSEDVTHTSGETGILPLTVRDDTLSDGGFGGTDGDYQPQLTDNYGRTWANSAQQTGVILDGGTPMVPKFAVIDHAASGDNEIVALVASKKIRVLQYAFVCAGAVLVRFESSAAGTALTGQMSVAANAGVSSAYSPVGLFETVAGESLNMELGGAVSCDGHIVYVEVL